MDFIKEAFQFQIGHQTNVAMQYWFFLIPLENVAFIVTGERKWTTCHKNLYQFLIDDHNSSF